jgi:hypothetical protein
VRLTEETAARLAEAIEDVSSVNLTGLDEVWGSLGFLAAELRELRRTYCEVNHLEFREA